MKDKPTAQQLAESLDRFEKARVLLSIHGMLSDAENSKCRARIRKWCDKHGYKVQLVNCVGDPVKEKQT